MNEANVAIWLIMIPGGALALAALLALPGRAWRLPLTPLGALPGLAAYFWLPLGSRAAYPWLLLGTEFHIDSTGRGILLLTSVLWLAAGIYALGYLRGSPRAPTFHLFFLLAMAGNFGLVVAADAVSFYFFFALMSFAAYGLVVFLRSDEVWRAGRVYMVLVILGEVALFTGLALMVHQAGTLELAALAAAPPRGLALVLLVGGFGVKAGMFPLHVWLPLAHPVAPVPAHAVLSGAMVKAGLLGWLRLLPVENGEMPGLGLALLALGLTGAYLGVAVGIMQSRPKTILAYSSVSQMGLITSGVGLALAFPEISAEILIGVLLYAVHHAVTKGALFLGIGVAERVQAPWVVAALILPALVLAGLPLTSGAAAKTALKLPLSGAAAWWIDHLTLVFAIAALGTTLLMARFLWRMRWLPGKPGGLPWTMTAPWVVLSLGTLVLPWLVAPELARMSLTAKKMWTLSWPLLLGSLIAGVSLRLPATWRLPSCPEGDLLVPLERLGEKLLTHLTSRPGLWRPMGGTTHNRIVVYANALWWRLRRLAAGSERFLLTWEVTATLFLALVVLVFALLALGW